MLDVMLVVYSRRMKLLEFVIVGESVRLMREKVVQEKV